MARFDHFWNLDEFIVSTLTTVSLQFFVFLAFGSKLYWLDVSGLKEYNILIFGGQIKEKHRGGNNGSKVLVSHVLSNGQSHHGYGNQMPVLPKWIC